MCQGESFESALAIGSAGPVVMRVFVKGNAGAFFSEREKIVASLAEDLDVPLLPTSWKVWLCRKVVDVLAELLEAAILSVYTKRRELVEATADANLRLAEAERAAATKQYLGPWDGADGEWPAARAEPFCAERRVLWPGDADNHGEHFRPRALCSSAVCGAFSADHAQGGGRGGARAGAGKG